MTKRWYAEQATFDGKFRPVIFYDERPTKNTTSGTRRLRNVREIPEKWHKHGLDKLAKKMRELIDKEPKSK